MRSGSSGLRSPRPAWSRPRRPRFWPWKRSPPGAGRRPSTEVAHGWLLRADHGFSARANSALALRAPVPDLATALAAVTAWYAARGLPTADRRAAATAPGPRFRPGAARVGGGARCGGAGHLDRTAGRTGPRRRRPSTCSNARTSAGWAPTSTARAPARDVVLGLLTRHDRVRFAGIDVDGRLVAIARGTVDDELARGQRGRGRWRRTGAGGWRGR